MKPLIAVLLLLLSSRAPAQMMSHAADIAGPVTILTANEQARYQALEDERSFHDTLSPTETLDKSAIQAMRQDLNERHRGFIEELRRKYIMATPETPTSKATFKPGWTEQRFMFVKNDKGIGITPCTLECE